MKFFKIEKGKGYFKDESGEFQEIDSISKEDIMRFLELAVDPEIDFDMDDIEDDMIQNQAHKIIYESLIIKFKELIDNKNIFIDESEKLYKEALKKYQSE